MIHSTRIIEDKKGHQYRLEIEEFDSHFRAYLFDGKIWVGKIECLLEPNEMELADIVIWEAPIYLRSGLWQLVLYSLYSRLKGKDYRQRGLGTELLRFVIEKACEERVARIRGFVTNQGLAENSRLLEWYEKHGFETMVVDSPGIEATDRVARIQMDLE